MTDILAALDDPKLFAPWVQRGDWSAWRAFLAALFALEMTPEQLETYERHTGRSTAPTEPFNEAWLVIGRRGGKSFAMALCAVYLACFRDYRQHLQPGERATVMVLAADRKQARVIMRYVRGLLTQVPMLTRMITRESAEEFDLANQTTIEVGTASLRTTRGYSFAGVLCDEISFWRIDGAAEPDHEILAAIRPGMATIPGAMLLCASSPYARKGALWDAHRRYYGDDDAPVLVWQGDTKSMNPTVPDRVISEAFERDPASASAEYGAQFRADVEGFLTLEQINRVTDEATELPPMQGTKYVAFVDPSGGSADSMTLAIAHRERDCVVLDLVTEVRPPFSPESVVEQFCAIARRYGVREVVGDRYAGEFAREPFRRRGIEYRIADANRSELYLALLPLVNSQTVRLLDVPKLSQQLNGLERRTSRVGRDIIDHAPGGHDDLANAAAGAVWLVARNNAQPTAVFGTYSASCAPSRLSGTSTWH